SKHEADRLQAQFILPLLLGGRFPRHLVPFRENRALALMHWHRHRMVRSRTRIMTQLQAVALNAGLRSKKRLWREHGRQQLESFRLEERGVGKGRDLLELRERSEDNDEKLVLRISRLEKCAYCLARFLDFGFH